MKKNTKGVTLIEFVLTIFIMIIIFGGASMVYVHTLNRIHISRAMNTAYVLAEGKMDEILGKSFSDIDDIGVTNFSGSFSSYSYEVSVGYVNPDDLNTVVIEPTDYKKITVSVNNDYIGSFIVESLAANYR